MITYIENQEHAARARTELRRARAAHIAAHTTAQHEDADEEYWESSKLTEAADAHLAVVKHHEKLLIEWDEETSREHHCGTGCAQEERAEIAYQANKDGASL